MSGLLFLPGFGPANTCTVKRPEYHDPLPFRFIWHHLQPESAGGATDMINCVQLCDSCHYGIHALLYALKLAGGDAVAAWHVPGTKRAVFGSEVQRHYAQVGYDLCVKAGTVAKIPNEGGHLWRPAA